MILTCPDCATSYFVDDERVPAQGRTVKCSSCGARWRAVLEAEPEPEPDIEFEPAPAPAPVAAEAPASGPEQAEPDDLDIVMAEFRTPKTVKREKTPRGGLWAGIGIAATLALAVGGAAVFRDQVVRFAPDAGPLYAQAGLPAGRMGLMIDAVKSQATFQGGRPVLSVTGEIHNTAHHTVTAPPLRINVLDKAGKPLAAKLARPLNAAIPPGGRRYFAIAIADPPAGLEDLQVEFEEAVAASHGAKPHGAAPHGAPSHGAPSQEARPHAAESSTHDTHG